MTDLHNAIRLGAPAAALSFFGLGSEAEGISRVSETLQPTVSFYQQPELQSLLGRFRWGYQVGVIAVAGELSFVGVRNPAGSNSIVVIEASRLVGSSTNFVWTIGTANATDVDGLEGAVALDTRVWEGLGGTTDLPQTRIAGIRGTGAAVQGQDFYASGAPEGRLDLPIVLHPGHEARGYANTVNVTILGAFHGYIKAALPGEL